MPETEAVTFAPEAVPPPGKLHEKTAPAGGELIAVRLMDAMLHDSSVVPELFKIEATGGVLFWEITMLSTSVQPLAGLVTVTEYVAGAGMVTAAFMPRPFDQR